MQCKKVSLKTVRCLLHIRLVLRESGDKDAACKMFAAATLLSIVRSCLGMQ